MAFRTPEIVVVGTYTVTRGGAKNGVSESTVSQVLLWQWNEDSSGNLDGKSPPLEHGNRGLVRDSRRRGFSGIVKCRQTVCEIAIALWTVIVKTPVFISHTTLRS
jgi:hypothetical protein